MKKNFFFGMIAASAMVLATSCSSDALDTVEESNEAQVTFNVSTDGATLTRAISDGTGADKLVYRVFDKDGKAISALEKTEVSNLSDLTTGHNVTLTLAKGQTYKVAFWAQNSKCDAYTVDDNMNVKVDYTSAANNDETRDAFFKTVEITVKGDATETVEMTRPFAQLNVANTDDDKTAAETSGIVIEKSSVTIKNAATKLNVLDGTVSGEADVTYTAAAIPTEKLAVDMDGDNTKENYNYLSMCYVLPNETTTGAAKTVAEVAFSFAPKSGEAIELKDGLQNIPLQRNYRTNIVGTILSANATFNVKIDAAYENDYIHEIWDGVTTKKPATSSDGKTYLISKASEWAWLIANNSEVSGKNITLTDDLDFGGHALGHLAYGTSQSSAQLIDGQGYSLTNLVMTNNDNGGDAAGLIGFPNGGFTIKDFTVKDVTVKSDNPDRGYAGVIVGAAQDGPIVMENVTVENADVCGVQSVAAFVGFLATNQSVTLTNCTVKNSNIHNISVNNESGFTAGFVGRVVGTATVTNCKAENTTVTGYYAARRGEASVTEIVGVDTNNSGKATITGTATTGITVTKTGIK